MPLEILYQPLPKPAYPCRRPVLFLPIRPYLIGKRVLNHLPADAVRDGRRGKGVPDFRTFFRLIPKHDMDMGVFLFRVECRRPLEVFPPDAVLFRNCADMVFNITLPCLLVGQVQFPCGSCPKGNHTAVHGDVPSGILVYKLCHRFPVREFGQWAARY